MAFQIPNQLSFAKNKPVSVPTWTRPADWISITDVVGEVQFLVSDIQPNYTIKTAFNKPASQSLYIDWGDGVTSTITTNTDTDTSHTYTSGGTPSSKGYNTWKIRIWVDSGAQITKANHILQSTTTQAGYPSGLLEAYYGNSTINTASELFRGDIATNPKFVNLEYVKLPSVMTDANSLYYTFGQCIALTKVVLPTSCSGTTLDGTFFACRSLIEAVLPSDMTGVTSMTNTFNTCNSIYRIVLPSSLAQVTTMASAFQFCSALSYLELPEMSACTNYNLTFDLCGNLTWVRIKGFATSGVINMTSAFRDCTSLQQVNLPASVESGVTFTMTTAFQRCAALEYLVLPSNLDTASLLQTFQTCSSLLSVELPTSMPSLTDISQAFQDCKALQEINLPTTVGATITLSSTFNNCTSLSKVVIPSDWNITNLSGTFQGCTTVNEVVLPSGVQNSITTMANTFSGCAALVSLTLPNSLTGLTNLGSTFLNCQTLESVSLPATLNSVTTMVSAFSGCRNLQTVSLPTSMSACATFSSVFLNCESIRSITLPATISSSISSWIQSFSGCISLETLVLPNTNMTAVTTISTMLQNCYTLTTLTNEGNIGNPSTAATIYINGDFNTGINELTSMDFYCKFSKFTVNGTSTVPTKLNSLRLRNNGAGQYAGTSPQINVSYTDLGASALDQLFTDLPTVTAKTINITGCPGAATCNRTIATGKGWTVTG